jgi:4-alpha-glucanotransferase
MTTSDPAHPREPRQPARLDRRVSGVLLHLTSVPGPHGNGDLGLEARRFVDWLERAEQSYWQMLPVGPCGDGNSPYSAQSAFAGDPLLIALAPLVERGWLTAGELADAPASRERVDYAISGRFRARSLRLAFERCRGTLELQRFRERERAWLEDYAQHRRLHGHPRQRHADRLVRRARRASRSPSASRT